MVYFFQQPVPNTKGWTPDLSPASQYGAFEFIFNSSDRPYADPKAARGKLKGKLAGFKPDEDYLCWPNAGDVFSIYLVIAYLTSVGIPKAKALVWQRPRGNNPGYYIPTEIPLNARN